MISRSCALAFVCALAALLPAEVLAQGVATPACRAATERALGQTARNEQLVRAAMETMTRVREAKMAGDTASAIRSLRASRRITAEFGPLIKAMQANAINAHRHGCIDDARLARAIEGLTASARTYRSLDAATAQHERELRSQMSRR